MMPIPRIDEQTEPEMSDDGFPSIGCRVFGAPLRDQCPGARTRA